MKAEKQKVGAKPLPAGQKKVTISLRLHPDLVAKIDWVLRNNIVGFPTESRTTVIEHALDEYLPL